MSIIDSVLSVFPDRLKIPLKRAASDVGTVYEIRLTYKNAVYFYCPSGIRFVSCTGFSTAYPGVNPLVPTLSELEEITDRALGYSGFSREAELFGGYITYGEGIRIGMACDGQGRDMGTGKILSLCVRIPFAGTALPEADYELLTAFDTGLLVAGAPSSGKTTLLRGIAAYLGGGGGGKFRKVCIIDERGELFSGTCIGQTVDVIRGKNKAAAISHAVRVLSPEYVICDEIGSEAESRSLLEGLHCGVRFVCSIHAGSLEGLVRRPQFRLLFSENVFDRVAVLSQYRAGRIDAIFSYGEVLDEIGRTGDDSRGNCSDGHIYFRPQKKTGAAAFCNRTAFFAAEGAL